LQNQHQFKYILVYQIFIFLAKRKKKSILFYFIDQDLVRERYKLSEQNSILEGNVPGHCIVLQWSWCICKDIYFQSCIFLLLMQNRFSLGWLR